MRGWMFFGHFVRISKDLRPLILDPRLLTLLLLMDWTFESVASSVAQGDTLRLSISLALALALPLCEGLIDLHPLSKSSSSYLLSTSKPTTKALRKWAPDHVFL